VQEQEPGLERELGLEREPKLEQQRLQEHPPVLVLG